LKERQLRRILLLLLLFCMLPVLLILFMQVCSMATGSH
jgi:hypothetical protein